MWEAAEAMESGRVSSKSGITRQNGKIYEPSKVCCTVDLNTRNFWSEEYAPICDNCKITYENFELPPNI